MPGRRCWMISPAYYGPSNYSPRRKAGAQSDAAEDEAAMCAEWSSKIEPTVQALYA